MIIKKTICRVCKSKDLVKMWDFGPSPLANSYLSKNDLNKEESLYPLEVNRCINCGNFQLGHVVDSETLFSNYLYASSTSKSFIKHFEDLTKRFDLFTSVCDIGSNDGILLKPFKEAGARILGIEPAKNLADKANKEGIETICRFFTPELASKLGTFDLVTATNSFAHIDDIDSVVKGVKKMIGKSGMFMIEVQYLLDQLQHKYFDNVYHEHVQYWTVETLQKFFDRHNLTINMVEHIETHGGSIRIFVSKDSWQDWSVDYFIRIEKEEIPRLLPKFTKEVNRAKYRTLTKLFDLKSKGKKVVGYGSPAKATTLCNYFGIGKDLLDYVVDDSLLKQGLYTPGKHIPIVSSEVLYKTKPDYVLILAWNFAKQIREKHPNFKYLDIWS